MEGLIALSLWSTVAAFVCMAWFAVKQVFFHPLSHVPGPFMAKFTNSYAAWRSLLGDMHIDIRRCHECYGDVIRYGPNRILTLSADGMHDIYGFGKHFRKAESYATMVPWEGAWSTATSIDKKMHRSLRSTVATGLSAKYYRDFEHVLLHSLDRYFNILLEGNSDERGWSSPKDMNKYNMWFAFDLIAEIGLGIRPALLENQDVRFVLETVHMHSKKLGVYEQWPFLDTLGIGNLVSWVVPNLSPTVRRFNKWLSDFSEAAITKNSKQASGLFAPVVQASFDNNSRQTHNRSQMIAECSFLTFTGSDAIATSLSGLMFYLVQNKRTYTKLVEEIRSRFERTSSVRWCEELSSCNYLRACIDEAMRMLPPASGVHWREAEMHSTKVGEENIPAGYEAGASLYAIFRNHDIFRNADCYWPERWVGGVLPESELQRAKRAFKPFSLGPRACAGFTVSQQILMVAAARLMMELDFTSANGERVGGYDEGEGRELEFSNHFTFSMWESGPVVQFQRRKSDSLAVA